MTNTRTYQFCLLSICLLFFGCKEFLEPSINKETVKLMAPSDGIETSQYNQTFWWTEVEDALKYRLQVVSPNFDKTVFLALDTVIEKNKFSITLDPGIYSWRVRAENGSSNTDYATASFVVFNSILSKQTPQLAMPVNKTLTNTASLVFSWLKLYGANAYQLQIDTNNFSDEKAVVLNKTLPGLEHKFTFSKDNVYQWRVKALSDTAQSKWSEVREVIFDTTSPNPVKLNSPTNGGTVSKTVVLKWSGTPTAVKYKVSVFKSDKTSYYAADYPKVQSGLSFTFEALSGEQLYWSISAVDEIGNVSKESEKWAFTVQ